MMTSTQVLLLLSIAGCSSAILVNVPAKTANVTKGGTISLGCTFSSSSPTTNLVVQWYFVGQKSAGQVETVLYYQAGTTAIGKMFENRVTVLSNPQTSMNASISISNMQPADTGTYTCEVNNVPDVTGQNEMSILVNVLVKPSYPYCAVHGDVESGHLVTLTCHSEQGNPPPTYTWSRVGQGAGSGVLGLSNVQTGSLVISNITQFQFGQYQCNASNTVGSAACTITLQEESHDGVIAGAVIGALLACVLVILLVWFITHHMKKQKYQAAKSSAEMQPMKDGSHPSSQRPQSEENPEA
ncbi:V-set and immunoglobulin domain-containing protein 1-like [Denticeps clupeoides]|uniref:V-set and immunoglobulin domain-containing protein 1-like n=1 Tax=Denticeps clupeoides TaxID=299321 RepID=UPI0010A4F533|nr:V-set and immunoglobulin domain-containing protein 1-like [Denticeps clupeoides]XP_028824467.1 V-set and immunoglobulin domain-containing protein 1-like [Denticeps clupeoides]